MLGKDYSKQQIPGTSQQGIDITGTETLEGFLWRHMGASMGEALWLTPEGYSVYDDEFESYVAYKAGRWWLVDAPLGSTSLIPGVIGEIASTVGETAGNIVKGVGEGVDEGLGLDLGDTLKYVAIAAIAIGGIYLYSMMPKGNK